MYLEATLKDFDKKAEYSQAMEAIDNEGIIMPELEREEFLNCFDTGEKIRMQADI